MAKNILSLQLLRNSTKAADYAAAVAAIKADGTNDGTIKLARFDASGETKTIFGIYHDFGSGDAGYTIYDADHGVINDIVGRLDALDGGTGSTSIVDQKIASAISALDYTGVTTGDGVVITNVTENGGVVSATAANVGNLKLTDYAEGTVSGKVESTDTLNQALAKLQNQIDAANEAAEQAISGLDATITAETGYYINKVDEVDGKISGTTAALPTVAAISEAGKPITAVSESLGTISATAGTINAEYVNVTGSVFSSTTVQGALEEIESEYKAADDALKEEILGDASESANTLAKLETLVNGLDADAATYTIRKDTESLPTNVKERYTLVETKNGSSTDKQVSIDIYKDNTLKSVELSGQNLVFTYIVDSGETSVAVDVSQFLAETEFGSGVTANADGYVHGVVDPSSESFLTVDAAGFKLLGVQAAINNAVSGASENLETAINAVSGKVDDLSAKTVTAVAMTGGTASLDNNADGTKKITISTDGSQVLATGYVKGSNSDPIAATDSINAALAKLENQIDAAKAAATTKVVEGTDAGNNLEISSATSADGSVTYTINLTDVASDSALTDEIAARKAVDGQNGDTYAPNTSANYISDATSLNDADVKLDAAIKGLEDAIALKDASVSAATAHITVQVDEVDGALTAVTLTETDIASASALTAAQNEIDAIETAVGLNADGTYAPNTANTYTSGATSVASAITALDDAVAGLSGKIAGIDVTGGNGITVTKTSDPSDGTDFAVDVKLKADDGSGDNDWHNPLKFDGASKGLYFDSLDCGTYA